MHVKPMCFKCCSNVYDAGPTLKPHWFNLSYLLVYWAAILFFFSVTNARRRPTRHVIYWAAILFFSVWPVRGVHVTWDVRRRTRTVRTAPASRTTAVTATRSTIRKARRSDVSTAATATIATSARWARAAPERANDVKGSEINTARS